LFGIGLGKQALPLFCNIFLNYPKLENATVYKGKLSAEGKESCSMGGKYSLTGCTPPTYYVTDNNGKHEIYFGLPGVRETVWLQDENDNDQVSVEGTFWFSPIFGVIDYDIVYHTKKPHMKEHDGKRSYFQYEKNKEEYEYHFNYNKYWAKALIFIFYLVFIYYWIKEVFEKFNSTIHK
jgi:hypothetical protein